MMAKLYTFDSLMFSIADRYKEDINGGADGLILTHMSKNTSEGLSEYIKRNFSRTRYECEWQDGTASTSKLCRCQPRYELIRLLESKILYPDREKALMLMHYIMSSGMIPH